MTLPDNATPSLAPVVDRAELIRQMAAVITRLLDRVLENVLEDSPFDIEKHRSAKPLYASLVPDDIFRGSHFERRFVTTFGRVFEEVAVVAATGLGAKAETGRKIIGAIPEERLHRIDQVLGELYSSRHDREPDWEAEMDYILAGEGKPVEIAVTCDFYAEYPSGERIAAEIKAPQPNKDQSEESKSKVMKLLAMEDPQVCYAYFALSYNPFGPARSEYNWSPPNSFFDMQNDSIVLIGPDFWKRVGGDHAYDAFIEAIRKVSPEYKRKIYESYLKTAPKEDWCI